MDNGNNNFIGNSLAKANYLPYGVDFPLGPSGRFTNGKNVVDLLGDKLGLPSFIPAFADPATKGSRIVHGVNFASGASGILDNTGSIAVSKNNYNKKKKKNKPLAIFLKQEYFWLFLIVRRMCFLSLISIVCLFVINIM